MPAEGLSKDTAELLGDKERRIEALLTVPSKDNRTVAFKLWRNQRHFIERMMAPDKPRRRVHLKARQVGESSIIVAYNAFDVMTTANMTILVICQDKATTELFRSHYKQHLGDLASVGLAPTVGLDNADMLEFPLLNSRILFETAEAKAPVGRAWTISRLHATEVAHWPHPIETLTGALQSVPTETGEVDMESTPNGAGGVFHKTVKAALAGKDSEMGGHWELFFYPWWETDEYISGDDSPIADLTEREQWLMQQKGLTYAHIHWRRMKSAELALTNKPFEQEYPEDPISCFLGGIRSPFGAEVIQRLVENIRPPISKGLKLEGQSERKYSRSLWIWKEPRHGQQYLIPADVSEGSGLDFTAVPVVDYKTMEVVAAYYDNHTDPIEAAQVLMDMGYYYNTALLVPETWPGIGYATGKALESSNYPNLYYGIDPRNPEYVGEIGWRTDTRTRPILQTSLIEYLITGSYIIWDERAVQEISSLMWSEKESGKVRLEAIPGENDDYCIALGIGAVAREWQPAMVERPAPTKLRSRVL